MKNEYWIIGIILAAMCLIFYSQINDSISSHRSFKVNMKQIEVINEISKGSLNSAETIKAICQQNEEIRQNNDKLTKQNRLLVSTTNALTEENEYLRKVLKQHDIELDLKDKQQ